MGLEDLDIKAVDGVGLRLKNAHVSSLRGVKAQGAAGDVVVEASSQVKTDAESVEALEKTSGNAFTVVGSTFLSFQR